MVSEYETIARNSGKQASDVDSAYEFVVKNYSKYLKTPDQIWWQVCNRLKLKVDAPNQNSRGGGKSSKPVALRDFSTFAHKDSVNVEGMVLWTRHDPGNGADEPESLSVGLADLSGRGKVKSKSPEIIPQLMSVKPGDFLNVQGGYAWVMPVADAKNGELRGVSLTKYTQVQVNKNFDPLNYFPSVDNTDLANEQTCVVKGLVTNSKHAIWKACPHVDNGRVCGSGGRKDEDTCFRGHRVNEWGEAPQTFLTVQSEGGTHEVQLEGTHNYDGVEVVVIGQNIIKQNGSVQIRSLRLEAKETANTGSVVLKRDSAKNGVMRTIRSYKRFPTESTLNRIKEELGTKTDTEAQSVLNELVSEGKVAIDGSYVKYLTG